MLDLGAAEALRRLDLPSFLYDVAGPETWPTLRLVLAAPVHALVGPGRSFAVEHGLSIACFAALGLALALAARAMATSSLDGILVFAIAAALVAGNRALRVYAADGMLEPLSALFTVAATGAWIASRRSGTTRPWALALVGNLLFHVKWQYGIFLSLAVLLFEGMAGGRAAARRRAVAVLGALVEGARSRAGAFLLAVAAALAAVAVAVSATGGVDGTYLRIQVRLRGIQGPVAWAALALFAFVEHALWGERVRLSEVVPERLRFLWAWLVTPMAA